MQIRKTKRDIARIKTVLRQMKDGVETVKG